MNGNDDQRRSPSTRGLLRAPVQHWAQHTTTAPWWVGGMIVTGGVGYWFWSMSTDTAIMQALDGINGIGILLGIVTPLLVWYLDKRRAWLDSLPLRMNVCFWYPDPPKQDEDGQTQWNRWYSAQGVFLAHEGDIRNWAQTLGAQLTKIRYLALDAYVHVVDWDPPPQRSPDDDRWFRLYEVHYPLRHAEEMKNGDRESNPGMLSKGKDDQFAYKLDSDLVQTFVNAIEADRRKQSVDQLHA